MISTQQPTDTSDILADPSGNTVASEAMQSVFGMAPHDRQEHAISQIISLSKDDSCAPLLLVRPTGGGKLAVRDTVGVILAGVVLTISVVCSLSSNLASRICYLLSKKYIIFIEV
jgi:hypothetical protein